MDFMSPLSGYFHAPPQIISTCFQRDESIADMRIPRWLEFFKAAGLLGGGSVIFGLLLFAIAVWEHWKERNVPPYVLLASGIAFFCFGMYRAWSKERDDKEAAVAENQSPRFEIKIEQTATFFDPSKNRTSLCICAMILNKGAASVALAWKVQYRSSSMDVTKYTNNLPVGGLDWPLSDGSVLHLKEEHLLVGQSQTAIIKGDMRKGRLLVDIEGDRRMELDSGQSEIIVSCTDAWNNSYSFSQRTIPAKEILTWPNELRSLTPVSANLIR
jgi:hypothetical protein